MSEERIEQTFAVSTPADLYVSNIRGLVTVTGIAGLNDIKITAVIDPESGDREATEVTIKQLDDGAVEAKTVFESKRLFGLRQPCKVLYTIEVPVDTNVIAKNVSGDVQVANVNGEHKIKVVSGNAKIKDLSGQIRAKSVSGKVLAQNISGLADFNSVSGTVRVESSDIPKLSATSVSGTILVDTPLGAGPYTLNSVSGSVKFIVPASTGCDVVASSVSGILKSNLASVTGTAGKRRWNVSFNGGGTAVNMKSVSGSLYLETDENTKASKVSPTPHSEQSRLDILTKVSEGELSVEDAMTELN